MPGTFRNSSNRVCEMGPQPPPVAPKTGAPRVTLQSWQPAQKMDLLSDEISSYGNHVRCSSVDSVDSNSGSSVSSSSSGGGHCRQLSNEGEFPPTRTSAKVTPVPLRNPLQFVKVQTNLFKKGEDQIKLTKEVKVSKETLKETEEEWQSNLDNWKSRRRKVSEKVIQRAEEMRQIEAEEQLRQQRLKEQQRKTKTFSQIVEKRSTKRSYNLDLYIGQGDDSGVGETPEPEEQEGSLESQHLHIRSDTSEGMTSETDSIDSDVHSSEKMMKEPPKVPKKPHSWLSRKESNELIHRTCSPNELFQHCLAKKDLPASGSVSSAEPSDIEGHVGDIENASSEDDMAFCRPMRQIDSGLDSLCDSHRPNDSADSASDLSQDSCSGIEKIAPDSEPDLPPRLSEVETRRKRKPLLKSVSLQDNEFMNEADDQNISIRMVIKPGVDSKGFGFTLNGGKEQSHEPIVDTVSIDSPAEFAGLKKGDKVLSLNGEDTSAYSHASLMFCVKQATHSGELEMLIYRPYRQETDVLPEEPNRTNKRGSSFAEKLAMFSGKSSSNSSGSVKPSVDEDSKESSLVFRRRSVFERSKADKEEAKSRRSSCVSPEDLTTNKDDRRYSVDLSKSTVKFPETSFKKPPPPVPVKPKLKPKFPESPNNATTPDLQFNEALYPEPSFQDQSTDQESFQQQENSNGLETVVFSQVESQLLEAKVSDFNGIIDASIDEHLTTETVCANDNTLIDSEIALESLPSQDRIALSSCDVSPEYVDNSVNTIENVTNDVRNISFFEENESLDLHEQANTVNNFDPNLTIDEDFLEDNFMKEETSQENGYIEDNVGWNTTQEDEDDMDGVYELQPEAVDENIAETDVCGISRDHFVQIDVHPLGLPLERIDEDDGGVSASTTPSSDTPDTETVIDNFPTTISPLPNDDAVEVSSVNSLQELPERNESPEFFPPSDNLQVIIEENSTELLSAPEIEPRCQDVLCNNPSEITADEQYELDESADQLSPLDVIDQIEMKLMQQLEQDSLEDFRDDVNGQFDDEVNRQLLYLSEDGDLLDDFDVAPRNMIPPSEPPPPPPPEPETADLKANPFQRINSTKRIKKELWRRRSDFLGLDSPEGISVDDLPPPPSGLEELLKSEIELQREQRLLLEKQMSHLDSSYSNATEEEITTGNFSDGYGSDYMLEVLDSEVFDAVAADPQIEDWKIEDECQIPQLDSIVLETNLENVERVVGESKQEASPQNKAKNHIQSLGAAPRAKIMDSNKWITQTEKHTLLMKQKSMDPVFREGSYNQNFWLAQEAGQRNEVPEKGHVPIDRRYSMPPAYNGSRQPNVTLRTWDDREVERGPPLRPKSAIWQGRTAVAQSYPSPSYGYPGTLGGQRSSWTESSLSGGEEPPHFDVSHQCSYCGSALTEGSAMGIDALQLYFHIECFRCCACHLQLGNGTCGTDVQVKSNRLYCPKCFVLE